MAEYLYQKPATLSNYNVLDLAFKQQLAQQQLAADIYKAQAKKDRSIDSSLMKELNSLNSSQMYAPDKRAMEIYQQELSDMLYNQDISDPQVEMKFGSVLNNAVEHMKMAKEVYKAAEFANTEKPDHPSFMNLLNISTGLAPDPFEEDGMNVGITQDELVAIRQQRNQIPELMFDPQSGFVMQNGDNGAFPRIETPLFENPSYPLNLQDVAGITPSDYAKDKRAAYSSADSEAAVRRILTAEIEGNTSFARKAAFGMGLSGSDINNEELVNINLNRWIDQTVDLLWKPDEPTQGDRDTSRNKDLFMNTANRNVTQEELERIENISVTTPNQPTVTSGYEIKYSPSAFGITVDLTGVDGDSFPQSRLQDIYITENGELGVTFIGKNQVAGTSVATDTNFILIDISSENYEKIRTAIDLEFGNGTFREMISNAL